MRIKGEVAEIIDVPGTYTLEPTCKAEEVAVKFSDSMACCCLEEQTTTSTIASTTVTTTTETTVTTTSTTTTTIPVDCFVECANEGYPHPDSWGPVSSIDECNIDVTGGSVINITATEDVFCCCV